MKPDWIPGGGFARATCLVFVLAVLLRLGLALVNSQANDDHISVIRVMLRLRDFGAMKVIFILPALLGFALLFARECGRFYAWCSVRSARLAADCALAVLLLLYTADVTALIYQHG